MSSSNREEFNKHVTAKREEMNVKIVTIDEIFFLKIWRFFSPKQDRKMNS